MNSGPKVPIERRRRSEPTNDGAGVSSKEPAQPQRRESDHIKARMRRWIELADRALGKLHDSKGNSQVSPQLSVELRNKE
jgi:hypothetical protein